MDNKHCLFPILVLTSSLTLFAPAQADDLIDGFSITAGTGPGKQDFARIGIRSEWDKRWFDKADNDWFLSAYFETGVLSANSTTDNTQVNGAADSLYGIFFTPVLRYQRKPYSNGFAPFVELGIGATYLSETHIKSNRYVGTQLGSHFQFEDKLSAGIRFGNAQQFDLSVNFIHYSNADIKKPNHGLDSYSLSFALWY